MNMVQILCMHHHKHASQVCKWKEIRPVETILGIGGGRMKENDGG
jgi:hypothetical protein